MKANFKSVILFAVAGFYISSCNPQNTPEPGLKDALEGNFLMGTAMNGRQIFGEDTASLEIIHKHFNSIVAENCMKSGPIQPRQDEYDFDCADKFVEFGLENDMYTVGHCLVWHSQAPRWLFFDEEGNDVNRDTLIQRMKTHIYTVVGRYKGKIDCWDVVNEAFEDDGSWRKTKFYEIIGEDYIELAFKFTQEADPEAELLYNDYSMFHKGRREAVVNLVNDLKSNGIRIDGVGMQAHVGMDYPPLDEFEKSIQAFADAGVDVHITELDLTAIPFPSGNVGADISASFEYQQKMNPYAEGLPDSARVAIHNRYMDFFDLFLKHNDKIKRVTMWGVADHQSWRNNWPIRGRMDFPLLFDREYQAKPIVDSIIKAANNLAE
ncbi:MAG: endo-1,4-beta-xylanase [Bacteroidota bacterium]